MIENVKVAEHLTCREIKKEDGNGIPKRQCGYCEILCIILDTLVPDWAERRDWAADTVSLMMGDRSPMVLSYVRVELNAALMHNRFDIEVYRSLGEFLTFAILILSDHLDDEKSTDGNRPDKYTDKR
jgi:hypothetical protein